MKTLGLGLTSLFFALLLPFVLFAFAEKPYLMNPWENAPWQMWLVCLAPIVAIALGHFTISNSRQSAGIRRQKAYAVSGLLLGYTGLVAMLTYPILNHRAPHFESSAVGSLRALNLATHGFADVHGRFPSGLSELACVHDNEKYDWCIDGVLAGGVKSAYRFTYVPENSASDNSIKSYEIHADPTKSTPFTRMHFFTNETRLIRYEYGRPAGLKSKSVD